MTRLRPARSTDAGAVGAILSEFAATTEWMPKLHTGAEDIAHAGALIDRGWVTVAEMDGVVVVLRPATMAISTRSTFQCGRADRALGPRSWRISSRNKITSTSGHFRPTPGRNVFTSVMGFKKTNGRMAVETMKNCRTSNTIGGERRAHEQGPGSV